MAGATQRSARGADGVTFRLASRLTAAERAGALPRALAEALFDAWCPPQRASGHALARAAELGVALGGRLADDGASLRARVRAALGEGRVLALREGREVQRTGAAPKERDEEAQPPAPTPRETKTWVTVRLLEEGDPPRPVAHARYRIALTDGAVREGRLDAMGTAHFDGLDPGTCEVTFPDHDRRAPSKNGAAARDDGAASEGGAAHVVKRGECLSTIARQHGFAWQTLYDAPQNAALRRRRPNPNVLREGDVVVIPPRVPVGGPAATGRLHDFTVRSERERLRVVLRDDGDAPLADMAWRLTIERFEAEGRTDADGLLEAWIPAHAHHGSVRLWPRDADAGDVTRGFVIELALGALDPIDTVTGLQARLNNLGLRAGPEDGVHGPRTTRALRRFQRAHRLAVTGELDDATRAALAEVHDGA